MMIQKDMLQRAPVAWRILVMLWPVAKEAMGNVINRARQYFFLIGPKRHVMQEIVPLFFFGRVSGCQPQLKNAVIDVSETTKEVLF